MILVKLITAHLFEDTEFFSLKLIPNVVSFFESFGDSFFLLFFCSVKGHEVTWTVPE